MISRVAKKLGVGVESLRQWVNRADIDEGRRPGTTSSDAEKIAKLERENKELRRANEIGPAQHDHRAHRRVRLLR